MSIELKKRFAKLLNNGKTAFEAAKVLYPDDTAEALRIAYKWPTDEEVLDFQNEGSEEELEGDKEYIDFAKYLKGRMKDDLIAPEDQIKFANLYADVKGYKQKPNNNVDNSSTNVITHNVMIVKDAGSDEEWAAKVQNQQDRLIEGKFEVIENKKLN